MTSDVSSIHDWLGQAAQACASDLHIVSGYPPTLRVHGRLRQLPGPALSDAAVRAALLPLCPAKARDHFEAEHNADFALELDIAGQMRRFRVNYFVSGPSIGACFRLILSEIPSFEWAGFPEELAVQLAHFRNGLVLVCGVTGAGKPRRLP